MTGKVIEQILIGGLFYNGGDGFGLGRQNAIGTRAAHTAALGKRSTPQLNDRAISPQWSLAGPLVAAGSRP